MAAPDIRSSQVSSFSEPTSKTSTWCVSRRVNTHEARRPPGSTRTANGASQGMLLNQRADVVDGQAYTIVGVTNTDTEYISGSLADDRFAGTYQGDSTKGYGRLSFWIDPTDQTIQGNYYDNLTNPNGSPPGTAGNAWCAWKVGAQPPSPCLGGGDEWDGPWYTNFGVLNVVQALGAVNTPLIGSYYYYYDEGSDQAEQTLTSVEDNYSGPGVEQDYLYAAVNPVSGYWSGLSDVYFALDSDPTNALTDFNGYGWYDSNVGSYYQMCGVPTGYLPSGCGFSDYWTMGGGALPGGILSQSRDQIVGETLDPTGKIQDYVPVSASLANSAAYKASNPYLAVGTWAYEEYLSDGGYYEVDDGTMQWSVDPAAGAYFTGDYYNSSSTGGVGWCGYLSSSADPSGCPATPTSSTTGTTTTTTSTTATVTTGNGNATGFNGVTGSDDINSDPIDSTTGGTTSGVEGRWRATEEDGTTGGHGSR